MAVEVVVCRCWRWVALAGVVGGRWGDGGDPPRNSELPLAQRFYFTSTPVPLFSRGVAMALPD